MTLHRRALTSTLLLATGLVAQPCPDFGSTLVAGSWTWSPLPLGCAGAPTWPMWQLYTPPHRAPTAHPGFRPGNAHALPRLLIAYRCTGFLFAPVVPVQVRFSGYVIDQPEYACS
jgi:hypothetical protein